MATKVFGGAVSFIFPSLGPALMISMGYLDLGKWLASVESGARFGFDVGLMVILFNFVAILCQYTAASIGTISSKNLAEICSEEYCKPACVLLGVQAEVSMITSELTMILGMAHGISLMFGVDLFTSIFFVKIGCVLLPLFVTLLGNFKAKALYIGMAGFALLFYVLGVLISQPEIPLMMNGFFPNLNGENIYSLMALLGANIMVHNFYVHSSIVQKQRGSPNVAMGALFHDHFFSILFSFTGIFLVNYVLMNSAADLFGSADVVLNFQDVSLLMDQIFKSPIAPIAFVMVLFLSSQITALNSNIGGQVVLRYFFGRDLSVWVHYVFINALSIIPALYCAKSAGAEGIYQLLIFCQVILAMLLPSSVIPLFRVASSSYIMGTLKISWYMEIFSWFSFLGILAVNIFFTIEMLFGNSSWIMNVRGGMGNSVMVPYAILLFIACTSLGLTFYLAVTPLKSATDGPNTRARTWNSLKDHQEVVECRDDGDKDLTKYDEDQDPTVEPALDKFLGTRSDKSTLEVDLSDTAIDCDIDSHRSVHGPNLTLDFTFQTCKPEESKSVVEVDSMENTDTVFAGVLSGQGILQRVESKDPDEKDEGVEVSVSTNKDSKGDILEPEGSLREILPDSGSVDPGPSNHINGKGPNGDNGTGSLSKLSGLGRAARRQLATILDEFWGNLFDTHGNLTQEANAKRLDVLLGLNLKTVGSSVKADSTIAESSKSFYQDADRGLVFPVNSRDYNSPKQNKITREESSLGTQMGSTSWSQTMQLNTHMQSSCSNLLDPSERPYSSLHVPLHSNDRIDQPATIHGCQIAPYLRGIGAARNPYSSSMSQNPQLTSTSASSFLPTLRDQIVYTRGQNELGSLGTSGLPSIAVPRISRLPVETPYYEPSLLGSGENVVPSAHTKKYHSSPDISALIASSRNAFLNEGKWGGPIGPRQSLGSMAYEQSQYLNNVSRSGVPLAFDELSPPKLHKDIFSRQSSMNMDTKSLWSRQPFEQLFGMTDKDLNEGDRRVSHGLNITTKESSYEDPEAKLLQSLRLCLMKILKLEGSDWLFRQNGGFDEELIDQVAASEKHLRKVDASELNQVYMCELQHSSSDRKPNSIQSIVDADVPFFLSLPNCGNNCLWRAALVINFGVWCIRRILELALVENRPELWGKYTYVLNRLQGIIEPAFFKPRHPLVPCTCLEIPPGDIKSSNSSQQNGHLHTTENASKNSLTTASVVLEIIKDVEAAVSGRKGRTGTVAGDIAFPKGKENLASVLKRYKRRLLNKSPGNHDGAPAHMIPIPATSTIL